MHTCLYIYINQLLICYSPEMSILVAGDSRAVNLADLVADVLDNRLYYDVKECARSSRNINQIQRYALRALEQQEYDAVIFLAGTCDITKKRYTNGRREIFYPYYNEDTCRRAVSFRLAKMMRYCSEQFPETKFILCTLYGMSLHLFNGAVVQDPKQSMLNNSIKVLKRDIRYINRLHGVPTVNLHTIFHRNRYNRSRNGTRTTAKS